MGPNKEINLGIYSAPDQALAGKVFLLTGASRGIGAAMSFGKV